VARRAIDAYNRGDLDGGSLSHQTQRASRPNRARPAARDNPKTVLSTYTPLLPQSDEIAAERVAALIG
jgi:hypothetical protein